MACRRRRSWQALAWGAAWLATIHLVVLAVLECKEPAFLDPKYGCRLVQLQARLAGAPDRPLCLILGSSRAEQGFRPHLLPAGPAAPVVFNLARGGSSPLLYLLTLKRLLADGIRPRWLLVEVFPPALVEDAGGVTIPKTTVRDFPLLAGHPLSWHTYTRFLRDRLLLLYQYRTGLLARYAPAWLLGQPSWDGLWNTWSGEWRSISEGATAEERCTLTADAQRRYRGKLQSFHISPASDRALRQLLALCRQEQIEPLLFVMPESTTFQSWYPQPAREKLADYLHALYREYSIPVIDARCWIGDDAFWDSHHLLRGGAAAFTQRFAALVLEPLLGFRPPAGPAPATAPRDPPAWSDAS